MELDFPRGPWKQIFEGNWSETHLHLFRNPEKYTLTVVEDVNEKGELGGLVLFLNKYFLVSGDISQLSTELEGYSMVFEENFPTKKGRFLALSTGPKYALPEPSKVDEKVEEMFHIIKERNKKFYELSKVYGVDATELKNASKEKERLLFNRPILLPATLMGKEAEEVEIKGNKVLLGRNINGNKAEEVINSFKSTVVVGGESREKAFHVLLENCVLSGVTGVIFDDTHEYDNLSSPNVQFPHHKYPELQPIGMPVRNLHPGEVQINLNHLDKKSFREIINIPEGDEEYQGKKATELIDEVIINDKKLESLKDIEEEIMTIEEDVEGFQRYRAIRMIKVLNQVYPDFMGGETDLKSLISTYLQSMGTIIRIDTSALPSNMKKALVYSFTNTILLENKREGFKERLRTIIALPNGKPYVPKKVTQRLQEKLLEVLTEANTYGIGYAVGINNKIDIYQPILGEANVLMEEVSENEFAVKTSDKKPYRVHLRPYLTS